MMEWWVSLVPLLAAIVGAVVGGVVVHLLAAKRETQTVIRAQRIDLLFSAYRRLISVANRTAPLSENQIDSLESAISDIVFVGEAVEVEEARKFMVSLADGGDASLDPLIRAMRNSIREELQIPAVDLPNPFNLRMERG